MLNRWYEATLIIGSISNLVTVLGYCECHFKIACNKQDYTRTIRLSAYGLHPDCMRAAYELRMIAYKQMPLGYKYGDRSK